MSTTQFQVMWKMADLWKRRRPISAWQIEIEVLVTEILANRCILDSSFTLLSYLFHIQKPFPSSWGLAGFMEHWNSKIHWTENQPCHSKMMKRDFNVSWNGKVRQIRRYGVFEPETGAESGRAQLQRCHSQLIRNNTRLHILPTFACSIVLKWNPTTRALSWRKFRR